MESAASAASDSNVPPVKRPRHGNKEDFHAEFIQKNPDYKECLDRLNKAYYIEGHYSIFEYFKHYLDLHDNDDDFDITECGRQEPLLYQKLIVLRTNQLFMTTLGEWCEEKIPRKMENWDFGEHEKFELPFVVLFKDCLKLELLLKHLEQ
jgi:hypothetical protein